MLHFMEVGQYVRTQAVRLAKGTEGAADGGNWLSGSGRGEAQPGGFSLRGNPTEGAGLRGASSLAGRLRDGVAQDGVGRDAESDGAGRDAESDGGRSGGVSRRGRRNFDSYECQTCKSRKYKDGSDDPGVSFKTPTRLSPDRAAFAVRAHEQEHVSREQAAAAREGNEVISQSVSYRTAICPECGRVYVSGGTTRTVTREEIDMTYGLSREDKGKFLNLTA